MKIIVTEGTQYDDRYAELSRQKIDISPEIMVREFLEEVKKLPFKILNAPYTKNIIDHLYLMHPETLERLDDDKTLRSYNLQDGSILRLMSAAR